VKVSWILEAHLELPCSVIPALVQVRSGERLLCTVDPISAYREDFRFEVGMGQDVAILETGWHTF